MNRFRDPAGDFAEELKREYLRGLQEGQHPADEEVEEVESSPYRKLFTKMQYKWSHSDQAALSQIRAAADRLIGDVFGDALEILDDLYEEVRQIETNDHGVVLLDQNGRPKYKKDEKGNYLEDWDQLTGQDIEAALLHLSRSQLIISQRESDLFLEAVFAKHSNEDAWHEAYEGIIEGTVGDRTARADRESREQKYFAYFRYFLWHKAQAFQKELKNVMRLLERIRDWRIWSEKS